MNRIHYWYIIGILVALLIGSLTVHWSDIQNLAQLLSFGLALSSLTLAIIAIIQALISGSSFAAIAGSITNSVAGVQAAAVKIDQASSQLLKHAEGIPPALSVMSVQLEQAQQAMMRFFSTETQPGDKTFGAGPRQGTPPRDTTTEFWGRTSVGGTLAYYLCSLGLEHHQAFNATTIFPDNDIGGPYIQGFIAGLRSSGVMDIDAQGNNFTVKNLGSLDFKKYKELIDINFPLNSQEDNVKLTREKMALIDRSFSVAS